MENKKLFNQPEIEVIHFDEKDVITGNTSPNAYSSNGTYGIESIKGFFDLSV
ncbi:MAG: hypothetical protein ACI4MS_02350 [Candidatus Coproplasma sp.]